MKNQRSERNRRSGFLAIALALSLVIPQATVASESVAKSEAASVILTADAASGSAVSGASTEVSELRTLLTNNLLRNYDPAVSGEMDIVHEVRSRDAQDILTLEAQNLKSAAKGKTVKYQIYDINKDGITELFALYPSGKKGRLEIYTYDNYELSVAKVSTIKNVSAMYKNTKKKQIVIVTAPGAKKTTITAFKFTDTGKLKKVSTYSRNKKTYKKGKKKIKKKAYNKYYKSVKKLAKIKAKSIPEANYAYTVADESFYSKDLIYEEFEDEVGRESLFMSKVSDSPDQDKCLAYTYSYDSVGDHEYTSDPGLTRYVFGPSVVNPKTGKTYQEEDWDAMYKEVFIGKYAPPFMTESIDENGKTVLDIEADGELQRVDTKERTCNNGAITYKAKEYAIEYGDSQMRLAFFTEGPQTGRIAEAGIYYPEISGEIAHDKWTFLYAEEAGNPSEHDPQIYDWITAGGVDTTAKVRTLTIKSDDPALAQTIKANENVAFVLYSGSGQFYTFKDDGTTVWNLPEENSNENADAWRAFDDMLNPANGQLTFADPAFTNDLYWKAK